MASIKAAGNQTRLFTRAQSAEEKKRLQLAAQQSALPPAASQAAGTPPTPYMDDQYPAGTGAGANQARNAYAQMQARQERDRIMTSGDNRAITQYLRQESMQRAADRLAAAGNTAAAARQYMLPDPYQAAISTPAAQPVQMKDHLVFGSPSAGFQSGMSAQDRASWDAIGRKYAAGDKSWMTDTNSFREDGKWGSYYDANGNVNGWLYAGDGMGGYAPVFGGKVGESGYRPGTVFYSPDGKAYTMGADGTLTRSGTVEWAKYGEYVGPRAGYQNSSFWARDDSGNYKKYYNATAPEEVLEAAGYYRDSNGLVLPIDDQYRLAQAVKNGEITVEQAAMAQAAKIKAEQSGYTPGGSVRTAAGTIPRGSDEYAARITPTQDPASGLAPAVDPGSYRQAGPANMQAGSQNMYQRYLDRWDYPAPPEWDGTEYERKRDELLESAMDPYEGSPYDQRRDDALAAYGEEWQGSEYQRRRDDALERAQDMQFNYDPNTDPVWQALQKQYRREGDRAAQDALGRYAGMTGGVPSSYAVTAASQAGDYYAAQLSDRLPQLYQDAYNRYLREYERQMGISDQYQGFDDREYSRWADRQGKNLDLADRYNQYGQQEYGQYQDRVSRQLSGADRYDRYGGTEYQRYMDRLGQYDTDRSFDYGRYRDAVGDYRYDDETAYDRNYQAQRDAIGDARYDRQWAQQLREYADAQGWKMAEWEQYLREYGDKLSDRERQWAYEMARDAEDRRRDAEETAWQRELRLAELAYDRERDAEADRRWETQYQQSLREYDDAQKQRELDNALKKRQASGGMEDQGAGSGGNGQSPAGKTKTAASGKNAAENSSMVYIGTHPDGRKRTAGYGELKTMLRNARVGGSGDAEQMRRVIDDWAAQGRIEAYEADILRREFGLEDTARGGASGGRALQYTK